jgi:FkbM family methyltransferase
MTLFGNPICQRMLEYNVVFSQYLMGIGPGANPDESGEKILIHLLRKRASMDHALCIFDVGANTGQFINLMEKGMNGVSLQIHAFEPSCYSYQKLEENTKEYGNATLNNFGLGECAGEFTLYSDKSGSGLASLTKRRLDHFGLEFNCSETVEIDTLDDYCRRRSIQGIDLLKLDVEGHELDVLRGGECMLNQRRIRMVSFEFGGCHLDSRTFFQDFFYFFKEHHMDGIFRITPSGFLMPIKKYKENYEQFRPTNFVVFRDED